MRWHWKEQYCEIEIILMSEFVQRVLQTFNQVIGVCVCINSILLMQNLKIVGDKSFDR